MINQIFAVIIVICIAVGLIVMAAPSFIDRKWQRVAADVGIPEYACRFAQKIDWRFRCYKKHSGLAALLKENYGEIGKWSNGELSPEVVTAVACLEALRDYSGRLASSEDQRLSNYIEMKAKIKETARLIAETIDEDEDEITIRIKVVMERGKVDYCFLSQMTQSA